MFVGHIIFSADKTLWHSDVVRPDCSLAGWVGVYSMPAAARYFSISSLLAAIPGGIMLAICALRPICGCGAALVLYDQYVARLRAAYPTGSHLGPRISRDTTHFVSKPPTLYHQSFVAFLLQLSGRGMSGTQDLFLSNIASQSSVV